MPEIIRPMGINIIRPDRPAPELPGTILLPKELAEKLQNLRPGQKRVYSRKSAATGVDFDRMRAAADKRKRKALKKVGRQL